MGRPALAGVVGGVLIVAVILSFLGSHASCSGSPDAPPGEPASSDSASVTETTSSSDLDVVVDARTDSSTKPDGAWFDGEYCPDPGYPPREDGCPCSTGDPTSPNTCTEARIGKICEYRQNCPPGPTLRYECKWSPLSDGGRVPAYLSIAPGSCPTNDTGGE